MSSSSPGRRGAAPLRAGARDMVCDWEGSVEVVSSGLILTVGLTNLGGTSSESNEMAMLWTIAFASTKSHCRKARELSLQLEDIGLWHLIFLRSSWPSCRLLSYRCILKALEQRLVPMPWELLPTRAWPAFVTAQYIHMNYDCYGLFMVGRRQP